MSEKTKILKTIRLYLIIFVMLFAFYVGASLAIGNQILKQMTGVSPILNAKSDSVIIKGQ